MVGIERALNRNFALNQDQLRICHTRQLTNRDQQPKIVLPTSVVQGISYLLLILSVSPIFS
jgi:hypothetical protein